MDVLSTRRARTAFRLGSHPQRNRKKTKQAEFGSFLRARRLDTAENVMAANYGHTLSEIAMQSVWPTFRFAENPSFARRRECNYLTAA